MSQRRITKKIFFFFQISRFFIKSKIFYVCTSSSIKLNLCWFNRTRCYYFVCFEFQLIGSRKSVFNFSAKSSARLYFSNTHNLFSGFFLLLQFVDPVYFSRPHVPISIGSIECFHKLRKLYFRQAVLSVLSYTSFLFSLLLVTFLHTTLIQKNAEQFVQKRSQIFVVSGLDANPWTLFIY